MKLHAAFKLTPLFTLLLAGALLLSSISNLRSNAFAQDIPTSKTTNYLTFLTLVMKLPPESPTDILLSNSFIYENQPINTVIGTFSSIDPNAGDTFTYSLVSGEGDTGNGSFNILGNQLRSWIVFEYEYQNSYSIRIRTTDQSGLFFEKVFIITIAFLNESPTDILLSNNVLYEDQPINTVIGTLSSTDPNVYDTFTYSLVSGAGDTGNGSFNISGNILSSSAVFDYETQNSYSIRVRTTDQTGLFFEKSLTIYIAPLYQNPTDILLSNSIIYENQPINTVIGTFSSIDPNAGDTFTYSLVSGEGDTGNGSFNVLGNQLRSSLVFEYEYQNSYSIRIRTTDQSGLFFEKVFIITIAFQNESPTDILLSNNVLYENQPINTVIGTLSSTDPNVYDTFTYSLVSGAGDTGNGSFNISGNILRSSAVFDYETQNSYSIRVRTTDQNGLFFEKAFTIFIARLPWENLVNTTFEGDFPGPWTVFDGNGSDYGEYHWASRSCMAYAGTYSGWAVGGGANGGGLSCGQSYPNYADSRMTYGPFSLVGASAAELDLKLWLYSETNYDKACIMASINGNSYYGWCWSGSSGGWIDRTFDLSDVYMLGDLRGQPQVWVAIIFYSDVIWTYPEGAYVDNIVLRRCLAHNCQGAVANQQEAIGDKLIEEPYQLNLAR